MWGGLIAWMVLDEEESQKHRNPGAHLGCVEVVVICSS